MAFTDRLREQHQLATLTAGQLRKLVQCHRPGDDAVAIATQLARLLSVLRIHLTEEDQHFYPAMIAAHDCHAASLAVRFKEEMGSLAWDVEDFMQHWSSSRVIALDFAGFATALEELLALLVSRMEREEITLYPFADALIPDLRDEAA